MANAKFWVRWHGSPVRLKLRDGEAVTLHQGGPTDEGWSSITEIYRRDGGRIICETIHDGVDCDGRLTTYSEAETNVFLLAERPWFVGVERDDDGTVREIYDRSIWVPKWKQTDSSQRDYSAEAMGY